MENRLKKSGIYGLILGMAISIMFVDYKEVNDLGNGTYVTTYKSLFEYIVTILRFSIIGMFLGIFIGWYSYERKHKTEQGKTYYLPFFFTVFIVSSILIFVYKW